jgi:murein DD-endopeptidase MepM/ murein hydrolase activator NlpD
MPSPLGDLSSLVWGKSLKSLILTIFCSVFILFLFPVQTQASTIRVSGFNSSRNPAPLTGFTPNSHFEDDPSADLRNTLLNQANFGTNGIVSCSVELKPFISTISAGSLVENGQKKFEMFFAGLSNSDLTDEEGDELAAFIRAGGIVYISGGGYSDYQGLGLPGLNGSRFNPLFSSLGISDRFPEEEVVDFYFCGSSSVPVGTPVTTGPFGAVDPLGHGTFNPINTLTLQSVATGFNELCFIGMSLENSMPTLSENSGDYNRTILAEGKFNEGYLSVSGEPFYVYTEYDENRRNYFLNLFALACSGGSGDQPPAPFLDLPWDYRAKGLSFSEAALAIGSYFDHEYPFLDVGSALSEPDEAKDSVTSFRGDFRNRNIRYSDHDGYDWLGPAKVNNGDPVLAAASGVAQFFKADKNNPACGSLACGNVVVIDHGNGYQTRYYHLQDNDPISQSFTTPRYVNQGEVIGKVGSTGRLSAPHIHFSVIQDKNGNGNFNDDRPDGLTDPFGWQSKEPDPWPTYTFTYKGIQRTGSKSYYLWTKAIESLSGELTSNAGFFRLGRFGLSFPERSTSEPLTVDMQYSPTTAISESFEVVGSGFYLNVIDASGNPINTFPKNFTLTIDFNDFDVNNFKTDSISIYSSSDGVSWVKEDTQVDFENKVATAVLNHASYFALFGEKKDMTPPTTTIQFSGSEGQSGWFRSNVQVTLNVDDNEGNAGVYYTGYKLDDSYFKEYKGPFIVSDEGEHRLEFYSVDSYENVEDVKVITFNIDKTLPEAKIKFSPGKLDTEVLGIDENISDVIFEKGKESARDTFILKDKAGNILKLVGKFKLAEKTDLFSVEEVRYGENGAISLGKNLFMTHYNFGQKSQSLERLSQSWSDDNDALLKIIYDGEKDESQVFRKDGEIWDRDIVQGMALLYIKTNNGKLEFGYE